MKGFSHFTQISHLLAVTGTSEWEQRSHCGCHTRSSLHSPFALPAVSPSPPTASTPHPHPQLWLYIKLHLLPHAQTHTHTHVNTPTGTHVLGGFGASPKHSLPPCWVLFAYLPHYTTLTDCTALLEAQCYSSPPPTVHQYHTTTHSHNT